jgi:hypothetical protein
MALVQQVRRSDQGGGFTWLANWGSLILGAAVMALASGQPAHAAERLYFTYGPLGRSISISELRDFAETGEPSQQLRWYLNAANLESERFRAVLTREIPVGLQFVDRLTYSLPGEFVLFQVGQVVHTQSRQANIQALRSALILSVSEDNRLSLLEFLENYPTEGIYVDGVVLARVANRVRDVVDEIEPVVASIEEFLEGFICECETTETTQTTTSTQ